MTTEQLTKFRKKLNKGYGGQDILGAIQKGLGDGEEGKAFEKMLEGGIQGSEVDKLKGYLEKAAPQTFGAGAEKTNPMLDAQTKFADAAGRFADAVEKLVPGGHQDVRGENPSALDKVHAGGKI